MTNKGIAIEALKAGGLRLTKQRTDLLEFLSDNQDEYIEVTKVDDHMRGLYPGLSHDTIYRNIKSFEDLGIIETHMQGEQLAVKFQCDFQHPHHHHFICQQCHRVTELEMCPMDFFEAQLPGAKITGHRFELYGICARCQQANA